MSSRNRRKLLVGMMKDSKPRGRRGMFCCDFIKQVPEKCNDTLTGEPITFMRLDFINDHASSGANTRTGRGFRKKLSRKIKRLDQRQFLCMVAETLNPNPPTDDTAMQAYADEQYAKLVEDMLAMDGELETRLDLVEELMGNPGDLAHVGDDNTLQTYHTDSYADVFGDPFDIHAQQVDVSTLPRRAFANQQVQIDADQLLEIDAAEDAEQPTLIMAIGFGTHAAKLSRNGNLRGVRGHRTDPRELPQMTEAA